MFHYFNISKYISISALFHNFSLMFCGFFAGFLKIIAPEVGFSTIFPLQGPEFGALSLCPGSGEFALSKNSTNSQAWNRPMQKRF